MSFSPGHWARRHFLCLKNLRIQQAAFPQGDDKLKRGTKTEIILPRHDQEEAGEMDYVSESAPGSFGDRQVVLHFFKAGSAGDCPAVLLLHGVHGWASPVEGNKYGFLARELAANGISACIAESSRLRRDRETFGDDRVSWAKAAFRGKTFPMEVYDACSAFGCFRRKFCASVPVLWGFSLGGLISVLIAGKRTAGYIAETGLVSPGEGEVEGLIVSGSGDEIRPEASGSLNLPVLDSLGDRSEVLRAASEASPAFALFFYGSLDETFSEESSRRIFDRLPLPESRKRFCFIQGADHSFRKKEGVPTREPLEEMLLISRGALDRYSGRKESVGRTEG
jgi:dienelactone hydrolase